MNVEEAAAQLGVSPRRVRALIADGKIPAKRVGTRWEITAEPAARPSRRPLSELSRRMLAKALHYGTLAGVTSHARTRTAERLRLLRAAEDPGSILLDWWGHQPDAEPDAYVRSLLQRAAAGDVAGVRVTVHRPKAAYLATTGRLSDRIATERAVQGLSIPKLAEITGIDERNIRALERGRAQASPGPARKILRALEVKPSALPPLEAEAVPQVRSLTKGTR